MNKPFRLVLLFLVVGALGVLVVVLRPQAEEVEHSEPPAVSEADLQMYIDVYTAMQDDHDITVENAIKSHNVSIDEFRQIERRIQAESRLVERVRQALLEHVKAHAVFAQSVATPAPTATPAPHAARTPKKKHAEKHR